MYIGSNCGVWRVLAMVGEGAWPFSISPSTVEMVCHERPGRSSMLACFPAAFACAALLLQPQVRVKVMQGDHAQGRRAVATLALLSACRRKT